MPQLVPIYFKVCRNFSTNTTLLNPSRVDVSKFSDNTTERDIEDSNKERETKVKDYEDKYSDDNIMDKRHEMEKMDKDDAKAYRDDIRNEIVGDNAKVSEELREDSKKIIDRIDNSRYTEESKAILIEKEQNELKEKLDESNQITDKHLWSLEDAWRLSGHDSDDDHLSSVGSFGSDSFDEKSDDENKSDKGGGGISGTGPSDNNAAPSNNNNCTIDENIGGAIFKDYSLKTFLFGSEGFNKENSTIDFIIEIEECTCIYDSLLDSYDI